MCIVAGVSEKFSRVIEFDYYYEATCFILLWILMHGLNCL
jgi:hypothetical protein